ncbi:MAG: molybdopterin molybdotransferase MoeA [Clostridia bacterium]|nr:molybdopterin molybdotransferase MoeA [Clostridia bacterium]
MSKKKHPWISREEYLRLALERGRLVPEVELVPVREAWGRITAQEITAVHSLPNTPSSLMDGIAIKSVSLAGGKPDTAGWQEGAEYVFSNTGVGIPAGYDTAVPIEEVSFDEKGRLHILSVPVAGQNVRPVGAMLKEKEVLVPANYQLGPAQLALLTAGGVEKVPVWQKIKVAILPTGNELVPPGRDLPPGKNIEFNGIMIEAQIKARGGEPRLYPIIPDRVPDLVRALQDALEWADLVIINGGTSKGTDDKAIEALQSVGEILAYEVDFGPGKHTMLTATGKKLIIGTVGPTIGAEYAVEWFVWPLMDQYYGRSWPVTRKISVHLLEDVNAPAPFDFYYRLNIMKQGEGYVGALADGSRSSFLVSRLMANGCLRVPGNIPGYKAGEVVEAELRQ